jgi:hypothetical protein
MKWLQKIFGLKPNDWIIVWVGNDKWDMVDMYGNERGFQKHCFYKIEFSKSRNKLRLETSGLDPKKHPFYFEALKKLSELQMYYELNLLKKTYE